MKRKFVQIAALCLSAALLLTAAGGSASAAPASAGERIIRVGLHYGTGAIEGLNFLNEKGSGYRFGYYDASNRFVELGSTGQTAISVAETMNVYYGSYDGYTSYHTAAVSSIAVGEYHLALPGPYGSFAAARGRCPHIRVGLWPASAVCITPGSAIIPPGTGRCRLNPPWRPRGFMWNCGEPRGLG